MTTRRDLRRRQIISAGFNGNHELIRSELGGSDPVLWRSALFAAERSSILDPADVLAALASPDPDIQHSGWTILARRPTLLDNNQTTEAFARCSPEVRELACFALGEREPHPSLTAALIGFSTDEDPLVRESVVAALGSLGDPDGEAVVLAGCTDTVSIRRRAVLALIAFDSPASRHALEQLTQDRDWQVRDAAVELLSTDH